MGFASLTAADLIAFGEKVGLPSPAAEVDMTLAAKIEDDVFLVAHLGRVARRRVGAGRCPTHRKIPIGPRLSPQRPFWPAVSSLGGFRTPAKRPQPRISADAKAGVRNPSQ